MIKKVDNNQFYTSPYADSMNRAKKVNEEAPAFLLDYDEEGVIWDRGDSQPEDAERERAKNSAKKGDGRRSEIRDTYEPSQASLRASSKSDSIIGEKKPEDGLFARVTIAIKDLFRRFMNAIWYGDDEDAVKKNNREAASQDLTGLLDIRKEGASAEDITEEMSAYIDDESSAYPQPVDEAEEEDTEDEVEEEQTAYSDEEPESKRYSITNHNGKIMIHVGPPEKGTGKKSGRSEETGKGKEASRDALLTYYDKTGRLVKLDNVNTGRILKNSKSIN